MSKAWATYKILNAMRVEVGNVQLPKSIALTINTMFNKYCGYTLQEMEQNG